MIRKTALVSLNILFAFGPSMSVSWAGQEMLKQAGSSAARAAFAGVRGGLGGEANLSQFTRTGDGVAFAEAGATRGELEGKPVEEDAEGAAVRRHLEQAFPGKKWKTGPTRQDTEELRRTFGRRRFFTVFTPAPLPPGAPLPGLLEAYERARKDFEENYLNLVVMRDTDGRLSVLRTPGDFQKILPPAGSEADLRRSAAALLTLQNAEFIPPGPVSADALSLRTNNEGLTIYSVEGDGFVGSALFDKEGRLLGVSKSYAGLLPN